MAVDKLRIGQKIHIMPFHEDEQYISSVYDMDEKGIYIPIPLSGSRPLVLHREEKIRIKYMSEDGAFTFVTKAIGRMAKENALPMYVVEHPKKSDITRVQLRQFVRVPVLLEVQYAPPPASNEKPVFQKASTVDLSGGGMKLAFKEKIDNGSNLLISFHLPLKNKKKQQDLSLLGRVIRCDLVDADMGTYHASIQFLDIRPPQQDLIMAYVFERMVEIKRRK